MAPFLLLSVVIVTLPIQEATDLVSLCLFILVYFLSVICYSHVFAHVFCVFCIILLFFH